MNTNALRRLALTAGTIGLVGALAAPTVVDASARHLRLVRSEPSKDSTVVAPKEICLFYSEAVKPNVAGVRLLRSDSSAVTLGALANGAAAGAAHAPLVAPITGEMKPGGYRVMWRVTGADGHTITGNFAFTVKSAATN